VAVADINNDGRPDFIVASAFTPALMLLVATCLP
jgi:hypothetical protein